ncbi:carbohydrate-binding family 6 protein [Sphingomonas crusticola]|uniref:carbohydrate-binding family 6 protein n=1 Tax=Sphingomonas crusticola TaxID=1697973 RepID=UPI000E287E57|nr:carbohydrate-binding family 6 protein [Sphingomonas crusticola]
METEGGLNRRQLLVSAGVAGAVSQLAAVTQAVPRTRGQQPSPPIDFANREIAAAAAGASSPAPTIRYTIDASLGAQSYRFRGSPAQLTIVAGDATGAMYGGLDVADALRMGPEGMATLADDRLHKPHVAKRGIKFNIPLDLRTPSYSDGSTSARANIPEVWTLEFWTTYLDEMARDRYNVLSLWNLHPFPSMVKVPEYPDVALADVWRSREPLGPSVFNERGRDAIPPRYRANHEVLRKLSIDQKIAFWRTVMQMAADRGIEIYIITWNIFIYGAEGKYGLTDEITNQKTIAYTRASVREMVRTYPLLAGIGITAGENLPGDNPKITQEQWLWQTYGEGVRDALHAQPGREFKLIHRFHETDGGEIERNWSRYPGWPHSFTFSYKYSVAHMYSSVNPPFLAEAASYVTPELKTWLTVRNDDIYSFRWGDPDFARDYVLNMPPSDRLVGFYIGPDGFCWGRDFLDRATANQELGAQRPLVMQKQWYSFKMWGQLAYDPTLPNAYFEALLRARFPQVDAAKLYAASSVTSKIVPQTTRFFWKDIDLEWLPEACVHLDRKKQSTAFYTVADFMNGASMPGSNILSIRRWRYKLGKKIPLGRISPLDCASALEGWSDTGLRLVGELRQSGAGANRELAQTIDDYEAMAHLGRYYADKIRGACALALYDENRRKNLQADAVRHLEDARDAWRRYASVRDRNYLPNFLNRIGFVDVTALTAEAEQDIVIARRWQPGTLQFDPAAPETRWTNLPKETLNI